MLIVQCFEMVCYIEKKITNIENNIISPQSMSWHFENVKDFIQFLTAYTKKRSGRKSSRVARWSDAFYNLKWGLYHGNLHEISLGQS